MKKFLCASVCALSSLFITLAGCSTAFDAADAYKGETPEQVFAKGVEAMKDKSYQNAIKHFEALDVQYPYERNTETGQLYLIYAYYITNDFASAEAAADRFIHTHPTNAHVDYAYCMRGLSNYYQNLGVFEKFFAVDLATRDLIQIKKSYADFAELSRLFPQSRYAPAAHQYMIYLRNVMANYELYIADYYYSRGAYIAAANRANEIVQQYQGAPAVPEALIMMVKSYQKLNLTQNAHESLSVLQYNFPRSSYLKRV